MRLIPLIFCFFLLLPAFGQTHLAIKNPSGKKKEAFYAGDWLTFKLKKYRLKNRFRLALVF